MFNVTLRHIHEIIVVVEKQCVLHNALCVHASERVRGGVSVRARVCACARVALLMQHAMHRHIIICSLSGFTTFFRHYLRNGTIFGGEKTLLNIKCVL
jgi:hypothetical protein